MDLKQHFQQTLAGSVHMALATSVDGRPNVRIVTFGYDESREGKLYFCSFKGNRKIQEFAENPRVACTPLSSGSQAQVRIFGTVGKSRHTLQDLIDLIAIKAPEDAVTMAEAGEHLELYELCFSEAWVTVGMSDARQYVIG